MLRGLLVLILCLASAPAWATTRFVDATAGACSGNYSIASRNCTGSDGTSYATLSAGLAGTTTAGDNLWVRSGTYTSTIVSADYTAGGSSWGTAITIGGCPVAVCGSDEKPTVNSTAGNLVNLTSSTNKYTILTRLILDGVNQSSADLNNQLVRWTADHIRFDNVEIKNAKGHAGACIETATGSEVINSKLYDNGLFSVGDNLGNALYWSCDSGLIEKNEFYGNDYASVWLNPGSNNIIRKNKTHDQRNWINFSGSSNLVYDELVYDLTGNLMSISYDCAPASPCSTLNKIYNNTIYNQAALAVEIGSFYGADSNEWKNNILHCTSTSVVPFKVYGADDDTNVITFNRIYNCAAIADSGTGTTIANNTTTDPSFTNAAAKDFTLPSGSNARDAGTDVSASVPDDYLGTTRPQNGTFDIGAYEYLVSLPPGASGSMGRGSKGMVGMR